MKTKTILTIICMITIITSCSVPISDVKLKAKEQDLPDELKGIQIYNVETESGYDVKVAVLNNSVNSLNYPVNSGKYVFHKSVLIVNKDSTAIEVKEILFENDSIIVCRK